MNAEITEKVGNELIKWLQNTGEFVSEQAPDVANQIVAYGLWSNGIGTALGLIPLVIGLLLIGCAVHFTKDKDCNSDVIFAGYLFGSIFSACGMIFSFCKAYNLILITVAPKLYIIDYISDLVK